jgi:hypothetical protein
VSERRVYAAGTRFFTLLPPEGGVPEAVSSYAQMPVVIAIRFDAGRFLA